MYVTVLSVCIIPVTSKLVVISPREGVLDTSLQSEKMRKFCREVAWTARDDVSVRVFAHNQSMIISTNTSVACRDIKTHGL